MLTSSETMPLDTISELRLELELALMTKTALAQLAEEATVF